MGEYSEFKSGTLLPSSKEVDDGDETGSHSSTSKILLHNILTFF